jgi:hypothetical protein
MLAIATVSFSQEEAYFTCKHYAVKKYDKFKKEFVKTAEADADYAIKITQEKIMFYCINCTDVTSTSIVVKLHDSEPETKSSIIDANSIYRTYKGILQDGSNEEIKVTLLYKSGTVSEITFGNSEMSVICSKLTKIK